MALGVVLEQPPSYLTGIYLNMWRQARGLDPLALTPGELTPYSTGGGGGGSPGSLKEVDVNAKGQGGGRLRPDPQTRSVSWDANGNMIPDSLEGLTEFMYKLFGGFTGSFVGGTAGAGIGSLAVSAALVYLIYKGAKRL